jgi:hypothetical protein
MRSFPFRFWCHQVIEPGIREQQQNQRLAS